MSKSWTDDIWHMHENYGFHVAMDGMDEETRAKYLEFRVKFLEEELTELRDNIANPEEVVDALIDLCVVAIGTLDAFGIRSGEAWDEVLRANMAKEVGVKATRPQAGDMPDLIKPEGWTAPSHKGNHGTLPTIVAPVEEVPTPKKTRSKKVAATE